MENKTIQVLSCGKADHRGFAWAFCRVLCSGHSLGAALATLCGAWAKAIYPNVRPAQRCIAFVENC